MPKHTVMKVLKIIDKEKHWKAARYKWFISYGVIIIQMTVDFSLGTTVK